MYLKLFAPKFLVVIYFLTFFNSLHAQRLAVQTSQSRNLSSSQQPVFSRLLSPLRILVGEITSRQLGNFETNLFPPETFLSTPEIIRFHGYPVEEHKVTVKDGYIISIFRINSTKKCGESTLELEPVLIQHGLISSSDDFLQLDPKDILPYLLADSGHNVWLGNVRGNTYGKEHAGNISSNDPKFYDFTMDDLACDLSEIIKYILKVENVPQLSYVGHSMGCTLISMAVSENPGLNKVLKKATFMAPGSYNSNINTRAAEALGRIPETWFLSFSQRFAGGRVFPPNLSLAMRKYLPGICLRENSHHYCNSAISYAFGLNPGQIRNETLAKVFAHFPADTSMKLVFQTHQTSKSGNFQKFDYGLEKNLKLYGEAQAPLYNLTRVTFPVQGFYSLADKITSPKDVSRVWSELGNVVETIQVEDENWSHLDFVYGKDARKFIYEKIVQFLSS